MTEVWIAAYWLAYQEGRVIGVFAIDNVEEAKLTCEAEDDRKQTWVQGEDGDWATTGEWSGYTITKCEVQ